MQHMHTHTWSKVVHFDTLMAGDDTWTHKTSIMESCYL